MSSLPAGADAGDTRRIACPRCLAPMRSLLLGSHRAQPVAVDHCPDCRLVWFDELESVQLDGMGWVRLLRELEQGAQRPLAPARVARPACPSCQAPLKEVRNRTRFGLFAALECPQRHGHLHSHSGLLAERGLVRPLGAPERLAMRQQGRPLHCLNCGGPAAATDVDCSYCGTALVVLDLPRLAHSLRLRLDGLGPSPQEQGRHVAWPCRGCGAALDPGRETSCSHCGHLVVALDLPDIDPLLDAAEADLKAAAQQSAQRRFAAPSLRPRRLAEDNAAAARPAAWARALMLGGWSPLLLLLGMALTLAAAAWGDLLGPGRPPAQTLLAQRLGDDPAAAWGWVEAYRQLHPDDAHGLRALRQGLLELYLSRLDGDEWPATATVASAMAGARARTRIDSQRRWGRILLRDLQLLPAGEAPALPAEALPAGSRWTPAAAGVWVERDRRNAGFWAPTVRNTGRSPLLLRQPALRMLVSGVDGVDWRCRPTGATEAIVAPGQQLALSCHTAVPVRDNESIWTTAMRRMQAGDPLPLEWRDPGLEPPDGTDALVDRLVAGAARHAVGLGRFQRREAGLRQGSPPVAAATGVQDGYVAPVSLQRRWAALPDGRRQLIGLSGLLLLFTTFCALARWWGERRAAVGLVLAALPLSYVVGRGQGAASVLLVGMFAGMALLLAFFFALGFRLYRDLVFRRYG